jgi:DNA repair protein RadC
MTYSLRIVDLPLSERPRERLLSHGVKQLKNAELMAILLGTGQGPGKLSAIGLGEYILNHLGQNQRDPLERLRDVCPQELMDIEGVGPAKATAILAAIELGQRACLLRPPDRAIIDSPQMAVNALSRELTHYPQERFAILLLDVKNRLLGTKLITIGTATETLAPPREIFREVLKQGATKIIVAHNHPSGSTEPSQADIDLTRQLLAGAKFLGVPLLDHLILGHTEWTSIRQNTTLWQECPQGE